MTKILKYRNMKMPEFISPTRQYVILVDSGVDSEYENHYWNVHFEKFMLPEKYDNISNVAAAYYHRELNQFYCSWFCIPYETYENLYQATEKHK